LDLIQAHCFRRFHDRFCKNHEAITLAYACTKKVNGVIRIAVKIFLTREDPRICLQSIEACGPVGIIQMGID